MNEEMFPNQNDLATSPGKLLQVAREEKNLRPEDVAYEIRLTPSQVLALEENDYSRMPEQTYVRGYLRNYARLVGVPENDILMAFARLTRTSEKKMQPVMPARESDTNINMGSKGVRWLAVGIIVAVIILSAVWVLVPYEKLPLTVDNTETVVTEEKPVLTEVPVGASTLNLDKPVEIAAVKKDSISSTTLPESEPESQPATDPGLQPETIEAQKATAIPEDEDQSQAEKPTSETSAETSETKIKQQVISNGTLFISYSKDSWTDIRDANGKKLLYRTVKKGEKIALSGKLPMSLFLGFAQGVKVTFNGEEIDVPSHTRGVFARFTVGEAVNQ